MSPQVISSTTDGIPKKKKKSSSFMTVAIERTTADDLPSGWIKEIRTSKSGSKMRRDPYYTDPVSGYMFRSKPDALRYLKTNDISSCACKPLKREDDVNLIENENPCSNPANEKLSMQKREPILHEESNGGGESSDTKNPPESDTKTLKQKQVNQKSSDSAKVIAAGALYPEEKASCEAESDVRVMTVDVAMSSPVTDPTTNRQLPEVGGRNKSGSRKSKERKDSSMPLRTSKRLAGSEPEMQSNLNLNERSLRAALRSGSTAKEVYTSPSFPREASDIPQTSNDKPAKEVVDCTVISEETRQDVNQLKEVEAYENSNKNAKMENYAAEESDVRVMTVDVAMSSPVTDPTTNQQLPESGGRNKSGSRKSKKRKDSSMPSRTSKRLAGSEPEMKSNLDLNERSLRAALRSGSTAKEVDTSPSFPLEASDSDIPQTSNIEPAKETVDHAVISKETRQDVNTLKEVEKPPTEGLAIPEEQSGAKANVKPLDDDKQSQRSQLCYDFGDSWSDPLEFALKTLRGELPIEDSLTFPSCFQDTTFTSLDDGCLKQPQFDAPINFGFASHSESSKKENTVDLPPVTSPSFPTLGNIDFNSRGGFNFQPSTEVGKKDSQTKFNP